ncbi:MAG TPA: ankyrin repeat domain-containing protein [Gemmatimonadales bacterium]|jgi:ankyrin repeat protein|nr:ankyrin repeat domain-containing protein [Gemmatimonadales bacterium]
MSAPLSLPDSPSLEWLRKQAKQRLAELRRTNPSARLAEAQLELARRYGFASWRALKARIDSLTLDGQLFDAAKGGDLAVLTAFLDRHPEKLQARNQPYEHTLLHLAAFAGHLALVDLLLRRGLEVNAREKGDNTYAMHWAAAAGHLDVVRRLADAGGDVVGQGDDHALEVIGWASCWNGCDDAVHRAIVDFLVGRGARHHIFSAIALRLGDEVRRIVAADPAQLDRPMSRNEDFQRPLHFAVRMNRPDMVALLLELGADPLVRDGTGYPPAAYATSPEIDRRVSEVLRARGAMDLFTALALGEFDAAARLLGENPRLASEGGADFGVLHLMAKRGDAAAVRWLLAHGVDPNARWSHWGALLTPLHLAALGGHPEVARLLLEGGADPRIRDSMHDGDALGWAEFFKRPEIVRLLEEHGAKRAG